MNNKMAVTLLAPMFLAASVNAAGKASEIRQIDGARSMAVVQTRTANIRVGDTLIATAKDQTQCGLTVTSLAGNTAIVDTGKCTFAKQLHVGQALEVSLIDQQFAKHETPKKIEPVAAAPAAAASVNSGNSGTSEISFKEVAPASETIGITVFGFYDSASDLKGSLHIANVSGDTTVNSQSAFGIGGEYAQYAQFAGGMMGYYGNSAYEFGKDWKSLEFQGQTVSRGSSPTMTMLLLGGGLNVLFNDNFYAKAGLNYNLPSLSGDGAPSITGRIGYEAGVGTRFAKRFNAELIYRRLNYTASGRTLDGFDYSIDDLNSTGLVLRGGYVF